MDCVVRSYLFLRGKWNATKTFYLQWDITWGNYIGSYNGGRLVEWFACMWAGIVIPSAAMHLGMLLPTKILPPAATLSGTRSEKIDMVVEISTYLLFSISIMLCLVLPTAVYEHWIHVMYTARKYYLISLIISIVKKKDYFYCVLSQFSL